MKKAYSYIRFSRLHQEEGDSRRRQQEATREYCRKNGLVLDESLSLKDLGVSAFKGVNAEKGALGKFLDACAAGKIPRGSALIVESLDRISRQKPRPTITLLNRILDDYGIEIHMTMSGQKFLPEQDNGIDLIVAVTLAMRANEESETKSRRLREAWAEKRKKAQSGQELLHPSLPWWLIAKDKKVISPAPRAKVLRKIFKLTADGLSSVKVARILNKEKLPTWRPKMTQWSAARVRDTVRSDAPLGILRQTNKTKTAGREYSITNYYPAIVSMEQALEARAVLKQNLKRAPRGRHPEGKRLVNLLRGLLKHKGKWMSFNGKFNGVKKAGIKTCNYYYQSYIEDKNGKGSTPYNVSAAQVESVLLSALVELDPSAILDTKSGGVKRSVAIQKKIDLLKEKQQNLLKAIESGSTSVTKRLVEVEVELKKQTAIYESVKLEEQDEWQLGKHLSDAKKFSIKELTIPERRQALSDALHGMITRIDIGRSNGSLSFNKKAYDEFSRQLMEGKYQVSLDLSPSKRPRKPMAMLVTFTGGAQRLICRGLPYGPEIPKDHLISMRVEDAQVV